MNKFFTLLSMFLLILVPGILAIDVAYIVNNPSNLDSGEVAIKNLLVEENYMVSILDNVNFDAGLYDIIIVSETVNDIEGIFDHTQHKTLFLSNSAAKKQGLSSSLGVTSSSSIVISNLNSLITENFPLGPLNVYNSQDSLYYLYGCKPINSMSLAYKSSTSKSVLLLVDQNSLLIDTGCTDRDKQINTRNLFFGMTKASSWNTNAEELFLNSIEWLLIGEDRDGDGHYDDDCNDNNADVWQLLPGYLDSDEDGYGTGSLLDVCSGEELLEGYSEINGDCDDSDENVNPSMLEIAYDGIDQDCMNGDLTDIDEDGYDAEVVGGDDCNDYNEEINPGADELLDDIDQNCVNDNPVRVADLGTVEWYEDQGISLNLDDYFADPEGDDLTYSVHDTSTDVHITINFLDNLIIFISEPDWSGSDWVILKAEDGNGGIEVSDTATLIVNPVNDAPECENIPAVSWNEDEETTLNLNDYCSDIENDELSYALQGSLTDGINLESLENGIAVFSTDTDWNGEGNVVFRANDYSDSVLTDTIDLIVNPVNDNPEFNGIISDIIWDEDTNLTDYLNLADYFSDIDGDDLVYSVSGNSNIDIQIIDGLVSFSPSPDWFGQESVVFHASDSEYNASSNTVVLTITDKNEPPEFGQMDCLTNILEENSYSCEIIVSDYEGDDLELEIISETNLQCSINDGDLLYYGDLNYFGPASCIIRVSDDFGYNDYLLEVEIENVNDAPVIYDIEPESDVKILKNSMERQFRIFVEDVDDDVLETAWFVENGTEIENVGDGNTFVFGEPYIGSEGTYIVKAIVTDYLENVEQSWNVFVGNINDFTCAEVNGHICTEEEICNGDLLGVYDTDNCCAVECSPKPPEFSDVDERCESLDSRVKIEIQKPDDGDDFMLGDEIDVKIELKNELEDDYEFDIEVYLYDGDEEEILEEYRDSIELDKNDRERIRLNFDVPKDIDPSNRFAIFVKAIDDDEEFCNEEFVMLDLNREKHDVIVSKLEVEENHFKCGDIVGIKVKVNNIGMKDEDVFVRLESSELGFFEETEEFELEKYDEDDEEIINFYIKMPEYTEAGEYKVKATVFFDDNSESYEAEGTITLFECKKQESLNSQYIDTQTVEGDKSQASEKKEREISKTQLWKVFLALAIMLFTFFIVLSLIAIYHIRNRKYVIARGKRDVVMY